MYCNGNLKKVKSLLNTLSLDEINRIEQNCSTALHASCHYGHLDIVHELLERGASRGQLNKNNKTPEDEACNEQIKELFRRSLCFKNA
jgi:ankyrin repeat protein